MFFAPFHLVDVRMYRMMGDTSCGRCSIQEIGRCREKARFMIFPPPRVCSDVNSHVWTRKRRRRRGDHLLIFSSCLRKRERRTDDDVTRAAEKFCADRVLVGQEMSSSFGTPHTFLSIPTKRDDGQWIQSNWGNSSILAEVRRFFFFKQIHVAFTGRLHNTLAVIAGCCCKHPPTAHKKKQRNLLSNSSSFSQSVHPTCAVHD